MWCSAAVDASEVSEDPFSPAAEAASTPPAAAVKEEGVSTPAAAAAASAAPTPAAAAATAIRRSFIKPRLFRERHPKATPQGHCL